MQTIINWIPVIGYESEYLMSDQGAVKKVSNGKIITPQKNRKGYLVVRLTRKGARKQHFVHRLIATQFIGNPFSKPQVNHIDGNKTNNAIVNLEWVTDEENRIHAVENNLTKRSKVYCITTNKHFESIASAEREYGITHVGEVCRGVHKQINGYRFRFSEDELCIQ